MTPSFWHRPDKWIDSKRRWHAYDDRGHSLCGALAVCGVGPVRGSRKSAPKNTRCMACVRAAADRNAKEA
jgi:hypothetical protein